jgi:hypothetical protein
MLPRESTSFQYSCDATQLLVLYITLFWAVEVVVMSIVYLLYGSLCYTALSTDGPVCRSRSALLCFNIQHCSTPLRKEI